MAEKRLYIGARYIPIYGRTGESSVEWDNSAPYEPLTIVTHNNYTYISRQTVPTGMEITNTDYWAVLSTTSGDIGQLQNEIDQLISDLHDETSARVNADSTLQTAINNEATARNNADTELQTNINNEVTARTAADVTINQAITTETNAREVADSNLNTAIATETTNRINADTALQTAINDEATARDNADTELQDNIDTNSNTINDIKAVTPTNYNVQGAINLINYPEGTPYTIPENGIVVSNCNYRANGYVQTHICDSAGNEIYVLTQSATNTNYAGANVATAPVFAGQRIWTSRATSVPYGEATYYPFSMMV